MFLHKDNQDGVQIQSNKEIVERSKICKLPGEKDNLFVEFQGPGMF